MFHALLDDVFQCASGYRRIIAALGDPMIVIAEVSYIFLTSLLVEPYGIIEQCLSRFVLSQGMAVRRSGKTYKLQGTCFGNSRVVVATLQDGSTSLGGPTEI